MKMLEFTGANGGKISIVLKHIQSVNEVIEDGRKGKANIVVVRFDEDSDDYFAVQETYREALMMVNNAEI